MLNKEQFNLLEIDKQVETINKFIDEFGSVNQACKHIGIAKSTVRDRFKAKNYYYDSEDKEYRFKVDLVDAVIEKIYTTKEENENNRIHEYDSMKFSNFNGDEANNMVVINKKDQQNLIVNDKSIEALNFITKNLSKIENLIKDMDMIKRNQSSKEIIVPNFEGENIRTTIKVNELIWTEFSEFASIYKQYAKQDIISLAFKEFIDSHKEN